MWLQRFIPLPQEVEDVACRLAEAISQGGYVAPVVLAPDGYERELARLVAARLSATLMTLDPAPSAADRRDAAREESPPDAPPPRRGEQFPPTGDDARSHRVAAPHAWRRSDQSTDGPAGRPISIAGRPAVIVTRTLCAPESAFRACNLARERNAEPIVIAAAVVSVEQSRLAASVCDDVVYLRCTWSPKPVRDRSTPGFGHDGGVEDGASRSQRCDGEKRTLAPRRVVIPRLDDEPTDERSRRENGAEHARRRFDSSA